MANLKRLFVVVLAIAMIATSMATAFAAPLKDIEGKKYEDAVNKLAGFGMVAGDNGQFKGENKLTRGEFATFLVKMLGLGEQEKVDTIFSDATSNDWYSGYVNAVTERGLMVGTGDNKFSPNKNVTYGEAITVFMKMLGYGPVVDGRGQWPNNYIARASSIKLTSGVSVSGSADVTRGNLAILMWATMTEPKLVESGVYDKDGNPEYVASKLAEDTLLYENFDEAVAYEEDEGVAVTEVPMISNNNDVRKIKLAAPYNSGYYTVPEGFDANSLLGMEVNFVADKDNNLIWVGSVTKADYVIKDSVKEIQANAAGDKVDRVKFMSNDKSYYAAADMTFVYNGVKVNTTAAELAKILPVIAEDVYVAGVQDTAKVIAVLDKDTSKINTLVIDQIAASGSVNFMNNNASDSVVGFFASVYDVGEKIFAKGYPGDYNNELDFKDLIAKSESNAVKLIVYKNDKPASLNDVKKNDFIKGTVYGNTYVFWIYAPKVETLTFDSIDDTSSMKNLTIVAGDKKLKVSSAVFRAIKKAIDNRAKFDTIADLEMFLGVEGTKVYYGPTGLVHYFENIVADSDALYGFVTDVDTATVDAKNVYRFTMMNPDGSTVSYTTDDPDDKYVEADYKAHVIAYKLNKDNEIVDIATMASGNFGTEVKKETQKRGAVKELYPYTGKADTDEYIIPDQNGGKGQPYYITSGTTFFNWTNAAEYVAEANKEDFNFKFDTVNWDSVKDVAKTTGLNNLAKAEAGFTNGVAKMVVLYNETLAGASKYGVVVGTGLKDGNSTIKIYNKGVINEYKYSVSGDSVYAVKGLMLTYAVDGSKAAVTAVSNAVYTYGVSDGQLHYKKKSAGNFIVGKLTSVDAAQRVIQYKNYDKDYFNGTVKGEATGAYIKEKAEIYNITDQNNITYSTDVGTLAKDMYFVYDKDYNVVLIVKASSVYERGMIGLE